MLIANRQYKGTLLHKNQKALYRDFCEQFPDVVVSFCSFNLYLKYLTDTFLNTDLRNAPIKLLHAEFEAQLDFGVCDVIHGENLVRTDYMVISFPRSNAAYVQVLETKNTIAILYYLQKIFVHLRGAPKEIWVDNDPVLVTGVTGVRRPLDLVQQFFDHYNMKMVMCSPARPCQKGNVERNVQICREHLLVPVPSFKSFVSYNKELLLACDKFNQRYSPKLRAPISQAFAEDKKSFNPLPDTLFTSSQIYRYEPDAIGRICLSGKYYYLPLEYANAPLTKKKKSVFVAVSHDHVYIKSKETKKYSQRRIRGYLHAGVNDWGPYFSYFAKYPYLVFSTPYVDTIPRFVLSFLVFATPPLMAESFASMAKLYDFTNDFNACNAVLSICVKDGDMTAAHFFKVYNNQLLAINQRVK